MKIYPKTNNNLQGLENLKPYIEKYRGIEIQMLIWDNLNYIDTVIKDVKEKIPNINVITIHPPIIDDTYNIEALTYRNFDLEVKRIQKLISLSQKYDISIAMLYHTRWNYSMWKSSGLINELRKITSYLQDTNVKIILENTTSGYDKENCAIMQIAKEINNEQLQLCIDICHLHCEANMYQIEFNSFLRNYLIRDDCEKYIYQIHFAATLDNDGYIKKKTHGRKHTTIDDLKDDYRILEELGIKDKIIVTEVSEDDYNSRIDQIEEIKMLEAIH